MPRRLRVALELAQLAGKIEGEQAAKSVVIALPDLLIGATALYLGYSVATLDTRHFRLIPGLSLVHVEAVKQILAEFSFANHLCKVAMAATIGHPLRYC